MSIYKIKGAAYLKPAWVCQEPVSPIFPENHTHVHTTDYKSTTNIVSRLAIETTSRPNYSKVASTSKTALNGIVYFNNHS